MFTTIVQVYTNK